MKKILIFMLLMVYAHLCISAIAFADPRMETNNNFCHFILDPDNTDNEIFVAGCNATITVVEKTANTEKTVVNCETSNRVASGYAQVTKVMPAAVSPLTPGDTLTLTSSDSATPCTMVESNGRAYTSYTWKSIITVKQSTNSTVQVTYLLYCQDGRQ